MFLLKKIYTQIRVLEPFKDHLKLQFGSGCYTHSDVLKWITDLNCTNVGPGSRSFRFWQRGQIYIINPQTPEREQKQINLIYYFWPGQHVPLFALFRQSSCAVNFGECEKESREPACGDCGWIFTQEQCQDPHPLPKSPPLLFPNPTIPCCIWTHTCWGLATTKHCATETPLVQIKQQKRKTKTLQNQML